MDRKGNGPEEYADIFSRFFDEEKELIYVATPNKTKLYKPDGTFVSEYSKDSISNFSGGYIVPRFKDGNNQVCIVINDTLYASRKEKLIPVIAMPYNEKAIVNTPVSLIRNNKAYTLLSIDKLAQYGLASEESVQQVQPMFPILRH